MTEVASPGTAPRRSRSVLVAAVVVGLVMALLVVLLLTRDDAESKTSASQLIGKQAPALDGAPVIGERFDIGTNDRWLLVNFFATWCTPCVKEHPELRKLAADGAKDGSLDVVSVVYDDEPAKVRAFFEEHGGDWTVLDYDDGRTGLDWGVAKIPESFLVAPSGVVVDRIQGGVRAADVEAEIRDLEQQQAQQQSTPDGGS